MLLGGYWSYYLPESIFHINFFKFEEALGGFDDRPASLTATIYTLNPNTGFDYSKLDFSKIKVIQYDNEITELNELINHINYNLICHPSHLTVNPH